MTTALALFSGGLDSILACRVIQAQGIKVKALKFVSPFFDYDLLGRAQEYQESIWEKYGIDVELRDLSAPYLRMLASPVYGYGKNFNPCVDCKILLISTARELMPTHNASFLITGEVVGQRPMSQRSDTLRVIERDSGTDGILLRPLCCRAQKITIPETQGLVDPARLPQFSGRNRTPQIELATRLGIRDFPSPAGGCILTDPIRAVRIRALYELHRPELLTAANVRFLLQGRQHRLPSGAWLAMGRNEAENTRVEALFAEHDLLIRVAGDQPGPSGLLRFSQGPADQHLAAAIVARYLKKTVEATRVMEVFSHDGSSRLLPVAAATEAQIKKLRW